MADWSPPGSLRRSSSAGCGGRAAHAAAPRAPSDAVRAMAGAAAELAGSAIAWLLRSGSRAHSHASAESATGAYLRAGVWLLLASGVLAGTLQLMLLALRTAGMLLLLVATQAESLLLAALLAGATAVVAARPWRRGGPLSPRALRAALVRIGGAQRVLGVVLMAAGSAAVLLSVLHNYPVAHPPGGGAGDSSDDYALMAFRLAAYCAAEPPAARPHERARGRGAAVDDGPAAASLLGSVAGLAARVACHLVIPAELRFVFLPLAAQAPVLAPPALALAGAMLVARLWLFAAYLLSAAAVTAAWAGWAALQGAAGPVARLTSRSPRPQCPPRRALPPCTAGDQSQPAHPGRGRRHRPPVASRVHRLTSESDTAAAAATDLPPSPAIPHTTAAAARPLGAPATPWFAAGNVAAFTPAAATDLDGVIAIVTPVRGGAVCSSKPWPGSARKSRSAPTTRAASDSATPSCPPPALTASVRQQAQICCVKVAPFTRAASLAMRLGSLLVARPTGLLSAAIGAPLALAAIPHLLLCVGLATLRRVAALPAAAAVCWWLGVLAVARSTVKALLWWAWAPAWPLFACFACSRTLLRCACAVFAARPALLSRTTALRMLGPQNCF
jgi:hypothetical protein